MIAEQIETQCDELEVIDSLCGLEAVAAEWREFIAEGVIGNNFFNDPAYILLHLQREPKLQPWCVVVRRQGRIRCIAPFFLQATRLKLQLSVFTLLSLPIRMLKLFGGHFIITLDDEPRTWYLAVFDAVWANRARFGLVSIDDLKATNSLWEFCRSTYSYGRRFRFFLASSQVDTVHQIQLPASHAEFMAGLGSKTRRNMRTETRKLCNRRGARLYRFNSPEQVADLLGHVDHVYNKCWQGKVNGNRRRNTLSDIRFLSGIAQRGWLRSYILAVDNVPVAFAIGYQYDDVFYFHETGYDEQWADASPGMVLINLFIEDLFQDSPPRTIDFLTGGAAYKRWLCNTQHQAAFVYLAARNRWRTILIAQAMLHSISRGLIRTLTALKLDGFLRTMLRQPAR
jgi:hypothetical protein